MLNFMMGCVIYTKTQGRCFRQTENFYMLSYSTKQAKKTERSDTHTRARTHTNSSWYGDWGAGQETILPYASRAQNTIPLPSPAKPT